MSRKHIAVAALLSVAMASAFAGDWYAVGSVGQSKAQDTGKADLDQSLVSMGVTGLRSSMDDNDTGYKLQLGYKFTPSWAVEGGYVDLGKFRYNATFSGPVAGSASTDAKVNGWNIAAVGILPINDQFAVFGKLGAVDAKVETSATATGAGTSASGSVSATKWKANYGLGATFSLSKTIGFRAELERFEKLGESGKTGESSVDLLSVGVVFTF